MNPSGRISVAAQPQRQGLVRSLTQRFSERNRSLAVICVLFFGLSYLYMWLRVDPKCLYHLFVQDYRLPYFKGGWLFLTDLLTHPGGLVEYASAFLFQFFDPSWVGAGIITCVALLLFMATRVYLVAVCGVRLLALQFVPSVLFLLLYNRYVHQLTTVLALLTALLGAALYVKMTTRRMTLRLIAFLFLSAAVYYAAAGAFLLYAGLCAIFEILARRRLLGACCLLCGAILPYVGGIWVFQTNLIDSYVRLLPFHPKTEPNAAVLAVCLYISLPVLCLGAVWGRRLTRTETSVTDKAAARSNRKRLRRTWKGALNWIVDSPVFLVPTVALVWFSFGSRWKAPLQIEYCARHGMWQRLLEKANGLSPAQQSFTVACDVYRALYHTGRLPYEMFSYPQSIASLVPSPATVILDAPPLAAMKASDIYIELGLVNEADHLAYEVLEQAGDHPAVLWRLVLINVVKGKTEAARVFLRLLAKDMVHGKAARDYLARLKADPLLSGDAEVQRIRSVMIAEDYSDFLRISPDALMEKLLQTNSKNRMAFEYQMAFYLLTGDLEKVALNIKRLDELGYPHVPRHYEEAILLYTSVTGKRVPLHGRRITAATTERFRRFIALVGRGEQNALAEEFWNSYFFYFHCLPYE